MSSKQAGSVSFDRTVYPVPFDASQYSTHWEFPNNGAHRPLDVVDESITGNTIMHIRVNDPDYDVSSTGSDTLDANTLSVKIIRGSATTGNLINSETPALDEISPTSGGIFELDLAIGSIIPEHAHNNQMAFTGTTNGMQIQQGDIITVEYRDPTDASGNPNTVTDSATFSMRNAVLQTDKSSYITGSDMILTLIEPIAKSNSKIPPLVGEISSNAGVSEFMRLPVVAEPRIIFTESVFASRVSDPVLDTS